MDDGRQLKSVKKLKCQEIRNNPIFTMGRMYRSSNNQDDQDETTLERISARIGTNIRADWKECTAPFKA